MLYTYYSGRGDLVRYACRGVNIVHGGPRCISFAGARPEQRIVSEILRAVESSAVEAALQAAERAASQRQTRMQALSLELEQARYQAGWQNVVTKPRIPYVFLRQMLHRITKLFRNQSPSADEDHIS
jgi:hypothetical protein